MRYHWFGSPTLLLLDLDTPAQHAQFRYELPRVRKHLLVEWVRRFASRTSGHSHVFIRVNPLPFGRGQMPVSGWARIALQAAMGSDPKREMCNYARLFEHVPEPILLISFRKYPGLDRLGVQPGFVCECGPTYKGKRLHSCVHLRNEIRHTSAANWSQ